MFNSIVVPEFIGTSLLLLLGGASVANFLLAKSKGFASNLMVVYIGWAVAVFVGVSVASKSGGYLNPAVVIGKAFTGITEYAPGIAVNIPNTVLYLISELLGAAFGAILVFLAYKKHYDEEKDASAILATFSTGPAIRSYGWNLVTEALGTFVLCFWVFMYKDGTPTTLGPLGVALVVLAAGACLGGPTGYAINPARDLGPRIVHEILPIKNKGKSDWDYSWVPVLGPIIGGVVAGILARIVN